MDATPELNRRVDLQELASHPTARAARSRLHSRDRETFEEQLRLVSIPAPTGDEGERAEYVRERLERLGMTEVALDAVGNVVARYPGGESADGEGPVVVAAHLDTIFPAGTRIRPRVEGSRVFAPGITDNARGLAAMLALAEAMRATGIVSRLPLYFVATVGEEGLGDLKGAKHLFRNGSPFCQASAFIALDGAGVSRIVTRAIGSRRLRATISGPGGHSWGDRGMANPAHALGLAITSLRAFERQGRHSNAVCVGRLGGGTSVNAIPAEAWLELDLRSDHGITLEMAERSARQSLAQAVQRESDSKTRGGPLKLTIETIGGRPCGETPADAPLVAAVVAVTRLLGGLPALAASSTDANVPISLGIPAITIGAGGRAGGVHTTDEWFENQDGARGIERALLTVLAVAGMQEPDQEG